MLVRCAFVCQDISLTDVTRFEISTLKRRNLPDSLHLCYIYIYKERKKSFTRVREIEEGRRGEESVTEEKAEWHFSRLIRIISASCFPSVTSVKQLGSAVTIGFHVPMVSPARRVDILVESAGGDV